MNLIEEVKFVGLQKDWLIDDSSQLRSSTCMAHPATQPELVFSMVTAH